jgi:putative colanic acid biosynthesis UDP-glucose lipid carrier transferase
MDNLTGAPSKSISRNTDPVSISHHSIPIQTMVSQFTTIREHTPPKNGLLYKKHYRIIKRTVDIMISGLAILLLLPWLTIMVGILIKLQSRGPVFFLQKRNKRQGGLFTCIKFRTMEVNDQADLLPASENDRRITPIGKFLREHYIDEIPQFLNVLAGDMSVIGPRPQMLSDNKRFEELLNHFHERHDVKPGITGLAQVSGFTGMAESPEQMKNRFSMDIYYVRNWTPLMDIMILFRTMGKFLGL